MAWGHPTAGRDPLLLAALLVLPVPALGAQSACPGSPLWSGPWACGGVTAHPGVLFKTLNLLIFHERGKNTMAVPVKKPEMTKTVLLSGLLFPIKMFRSGISHFTDVFWWEKGWDVLFGSTEICNQGWYVHIMF